ncbi:MFS transporter [Tumebacillus flagellatus]|uniref:Major facilitator superfamily (MFS) profile domain-containing protein n=1 Tax=Tumebacillus flagellatus TaxID=1157490 RepID=A0A074LQR0_9BACL|nr:MFS transporter [Tumebacillus flagellatus]KEO83439.1 hypothetical protein EL26_10730 [Tumebacillus flagellatus]
MSNTDAATSSPPKAPGMRDLLANRNYCYLVFAQFVSDLGDGVYALALLWAMKILTGSGVQMSMVLTAELIPTILIGIFAGVFVDLGKKKAFLLTADICRGVVVAALGFLWYTSQLQPWMLVAAAVLLSSFSAFFTPARMVSLRTLVPAENMMKAQSVSQTIQTVVGLCAPALSAILLAFNVSFSFWFNAASFLLSFLLILFIRHADLNKKKEGKADFTAIKASLKVGFKTVFQTALLRNLILYVVLLNFMFAPVSVLFPLYADTANALASYDIAFFVGILLGSIALGFFSKARKIVPMTVGLLLILGGFFGLVYCNAFALVLACMVLIGLGMPITNGTLMTVFMTAVPQEVLGRAGSTMNVLSQCAKPISLSMIGSLILLFSVRDLFLYISILGLAVVVLMVLNPTVRKAE